jgi:hypothetical protein
MSWLLTSVASSKVDWILIFVFLHERWKHRYHILTRDFIWLKTVGWVNLWVINQFSIF